MGAGTEGFLNRSSLFVYRKSDAVHRGLHCWHDDPNGLWEERCGLDSLRSEDTLGLLHVNGGTRSERRWNEDPHDKEERRERTEVWKSVVDVREESLDCLPGTSP